MGKNLERSIIHSLDKGVTKADLGWYVISALSLSQNCLSKRPSYKNAVRDSYTRFIAHINNRIENQGFGYMADFFNENVLSGLIRNYNNAKLSDMKNCLEYIVGEYVTKELGEGIITEENKVEISADVLRRKKARSQVLVKLGSALLKGLDRISYMMENNQSLDKKKRYKILLNSIKEHL